MRVGLQLGPERGRGAQKVRKLVADARAAEELGFATVWTPQIPGDFDAMTAVALMGDGTARIELGTAVVPLQTRHPVVLAQQALSTQAVCEGRFTLGVGPSHHWIIEDQFGLPYERPAHVVREYLEVMNATFAGPGQVDVENELFRVHAPNDVTDVPVSHLEAPGHRPSGARLRPRPDRSQAKLANSVPITAEQGSSCAEPHA